MEEITGRRIQLHYSVSISRINLISKKLLWLNHESFVVVVLVVLWFYVLHSLLHMSFWYTCKFCVGCLKLIEKNYKKRDLTTDAIESVAKVLIVLFSSSIMGIGFWATCSFFFSFVFSGWLPIFIYETMYFENIWSFQLRPLQSQFSEYWVITLNRGRHHRFKMAEVFFCK